MPLITGYTGKLNDIHITTLMGEIWGIPLNAEQAFVIGDQVSSSVSFVTQRDAAFNAIKALMAYPNLEARVLDLIGQWTDLPPAGTVEDEAKGTVIDVPKAQRAIRKALLGIYGVVPADDHGNIPEGL